jgi:hypothetical protein
MPDEIEYDEAASDRALDEVAKWHAARPQAEKDEELKRLKEMQEASRRMFGPHQGPPVDTSPAS